MMKHFCTIILILLMAANLSAQHDPIQPYEDLGIKVKVLTLSNGKYQESFPNDTLHRIGSVLFNRVTGEVETVVVDTIHGEYSLRADVPSRWLSPDPLATKFPAWSPYNFATDNPIIFNDPDGQEIYLVINGESVNISTSLDLVTDTKLKAAIQDMRSRHLGKHVWDEFADSKTDDVYLRVVDIADNSFENFNPHVATTSANLPHYQIKNGKVDKFMGNRTIVAFDGVDVSESLKKDDGQATSRIHLIAIENDRLNESAFSLGADIYHEMTFHVFFDALRVLSEEFQHEISGSTHAGLTIDSFMAKGELDINILEKHKNEALKFLEENKLTIEKKGMDFEKLKWKVEKFNLEAYAKDNEPTYHPEYNPEGGN